ncbi:MAG: peptidyl-prolyl cis-trans isomerase, partial [Acidimicrobiales bacterium]|nr:peptidyl-prolyl cis-trans isomerase [Acidimicrobiales bacterium]
AVYDQLVAGADFEELARGPENAEELRSRAGDLGCPSPSDLQANLPPEMVAAIDATPPGAVTVPLDGGFGYEIFKVKSRGIPSFEEVRQEIEQSLSQQDSQRLLDEKLAELAGDLEVTVDPLFGSLNRARGTIEAPGGAAAPPATLVVPTTTSTTTVDSEAPLPVAPGGTATTADTNSSAVEVGDHA